MAIRLYVFFSGCNNICTRFSSNWSNTFWTYKMWNPPKHSHWWPDDWAFFFPNVIMHYFCEIATYYFLSAIMLYMHPHVSGTECVGFLKARCLREPGSQNSDICVRTWNPVHGDSQIRQHLNFHVRTWNLVQLLNFPVSASCRRHLLWT